MKRKFSMFLNIAMLCLCVCAIAFGVYSAQQARLNISGNLGFTAHNAFVSVTGTIKNVAKIENDNVVSKTDMKIDKIVKSADTVDPVDITMPLGDIYFYSSNNNVSAEDIVFELTFTNLGATDVLATITKPTISSKVSVVDNSDNNHGLYISFGETGEHQFGIYKGKSQTISFAMHLNDVSTLSSKVSFNIPIDFEEWIYKIGVTVKLFTSEEQSNIKTGLGGVKDVSFADNILCYAERFPYYIEMGTDPTNTYSSGKLRWLIVGTMDENDNITPFNFFKSDSANYAESQLDKSAFDSGLMLNKNYCLVSEKVLYTESISDYGLSYQNAYKDGTAPWLNTKYGVNANDYATSNIRAYLKGTSVQRSATILDGVYSPSGTEVNLFTTYNIKSDPLYSCIQARTLNSLYKKIGENYTDIMVPSDKQNYSTIDRTSDKLWLLSGKEVVTIFSADYSRGCYMSARTSVLGAALDANWWFRSYSDVADSTSLVEYIITGYYDIDYVEDEFGVRPAFKI